MRPILCSYGQLPCTNPCSPVWWPCPCLYLFMCVHSAKKTNRAREPRLEGTWRKFLPSPKGPASGWHSVVCLIPGDYIKLAYENIAFLCCIKRTLERWRLVSLFTGNMGEAGPFHRCGTKQGWEEVGWHLVPKLDILSLSSFYQWPGSSQPLCPPHVDTPSRVRVLTKGGPSWVRLSVD